MNGIADAFWSVARRATAPDAAAQTGAGAQVTLSKTASSLTGRGRADPGIASVVSIAAVALCMLDSPSLACEEGDAPSACPKLAQSSTSSLPSASSRREFDQQIADCIKVTLSPEQIISTCSKALDATSLDYIRNLQMEKKTPQDTGRAIAAIYFARATAYEKKKQFGAALSDLNQAINRAPQISGYLGMRGCLCSEMGRYALAIADLDNYIKSDVSVSLGAFLCRAAIYEKEERYSDTNQGL